MELDFDTLLCMLAYFSEQPAGQYNEEVIELIRRELNKFDGITFN